MKSSENTDPLALRTTELIHKIDEASSTLLSRFCQIIDVISVGTCKKFSLLCS
uniref:Uncharacterized protein n=1 Tax=Pneumocystis jirovecii TaxID=42068 RepID=A0EPW2_PNEJI|nr:hypothetical protein [Pneumocystis jirovecii]